MTDRPEDVVDPADTAPPRDLFVEVVRVIKLVNATRAKAPLAEAGVERAAYPILFTLRERPMRLTALAELIHSDVSTVSRQVAQLSHAGVVHKDPDPRDRRAQVVSLSPAGVELVSQVRAARATWMASVLQDWEESEITDLTRSLRRFGDALEQAVTKGHLPTTP